MTVRCPRCGTLYRRPQSARRATDVTFRCARCRHVFAVVAEEPAVESEEADDETTRFVFDDDERGEPEEDAPPDEGEPEEAVVEAAPPDPPPFMTPARFALRALLGVSLSYAVLSVYLYTHPEDARRALARIPLLGATLVETRLSPASVQLSGVRGEYQRVKGDHLVFVITGTAVNHAPLRVKGIQIEARIVGAEEKRQVVFCGAAPRDIRDLSLREIALLQTLEPPRDWTLGPGEQTDFLVAFAAPPPALREFTAQVLAVQAPGRRSGGPASSSRPSYDFFALAFASVSPGVTSISGGSRSPFLKACTPLPMLPMTSGSRPAPKMTRTITSTTRSSPIPKPNMEG
jgi:predicted Zn finger-like uncharacterized protein